MSGRLSRNKGRREEQQLVLALTQLNYKAERILRQYQEAGQPDVKATKGDKTYTFEMKSRKNSFKTIYDLYYAEREEDSLLCYVLTSLGSAIAVSSSFEALGKFPDNRSFRNLEKFPLFDKKMAKAAIRLLKLKELKQTADFLVIRDNTKPRLYIRYW